MNKIKIACVLSFLVFGVVIFFTDNSLLPTVSSFSEGPSPGLTGAPGELDCTFCHDPNSGPGVFTITAPSNYTPGQTYQIQVQHATTDETRLRWGFELTSLDGTNSAAGTFANTTAFTRDDFGDGRFYITHNQAGTFAGTGGGATWSFDWIAPATNVGPVTFYAAGNQADNNSSTSGDQIYLTTTVSQQGILSGTAFYVNASSPPRYVSNVLLSGSGSPNVSTTTAGLGPLAGTYTLSGFGSGAYTVTPTKTGGVNGISSFDAARIAQHVAGIPPILNATQLVAADASGNGNVTSFDAAQIAQFVVSTVGGITGTWKFQPANRTYSSVSGNVAGEDYNAILVGEVSGNWNNTGARPAPRADARRSTTVEAPHLVTKTGEAVVIPVAVQGIAKKGIISYEFDLRYDPTVIQPEKNAVDVAGTVSRGLSAVFNADEPGLLRVAVYGPVAIDNGGVLLNLNFTAVGSAGSTSPLTWERILLNEGTPVVTTTDGQIEIF